MLSIADVGSHTTGPEGADHQEIGTHPPCGAYPDSLPLVGLVWGMHTLAQCCREPQHGAGTRTWGTGGGGGIAQRLSGVKAEGQQHGSGGSSLIPDHRPSCAWRLGYWPLTFGETTVRSGMRAEGFGVWGGCPLGPKKHRQTGPTWTGLLRLDQTLFIRGP